MSAEKQRLPAAAMKVSAAIVLAWAGYEGFSAAPYVPTVGDVPTIGHGATHYEDGRRVTLQDSPITRQRASELAVNLLEKQYGACVRQALGSTLVHPAEFALAVDFAGQYGCGAWSGSQMLRKTRAGDYYGACQGYISYRYMTDDRPHPGWESYKPGRWRFDCSTPGNKRCMGVWTRQLNRYTSCMEAQ